ncbi:hypothetical protein GGS23DRAFT_583354 [Durotheca rogersii]|uniref:uncharacterized protein n=1 Tax=Durotheca rogersii TaxID=419775 RepID=UPI002220CB85|nr:uncharacterized protein GGS23DRAFT_583354 [Durotheca rogersii]KAI5859985.1 hypothetical protein GGS23DRAFT_583354 [Durotheca rogersii]
MGIQAADIDSDQGLETMLKTQLRLLERLPEKNELNEITSAPLFTYPVLAHAKKLAAESSARSFSQYALFAGDSDGLRQKATDPRIFHNVSAPSSVFICGSQGSGKSHTLSCILENCLIQSSELGSLSKPLTGIVFHYDTFVSDTMASPCEAAYLASNPSVKVRVLCSPTNIGTMKKCYGRLPNVDVEELRLKESHLNTKRMLDLMAFDDQGSPLYFQVIQRILREMRIAQQSTGSGFKYREFTSLLAGEDLLPGQIRPLNQRLDMLESFMVPSETQSNTSYSTWGCTGTDWTPRASSLTIIDLSCPCVTAAMACSLFNVCLSIFLEQDSSLGRVIALDEAHKYMGESAECATLTNNLLSAIRLQRHLGARVVISTQEPTISPKLLDLCSVTVVHRFTSPDWLHVLTKHLAGISTMTKVAGQLDDADGGAPLAPATEADGLRGMVVASDSPILELFARIVSLATGEALVFAPSAIVGLDTRSVPGGGSLVTHRRLAHHVLHVRVRGRITTDGGQSVMAV